MPDVESHHEFDVGVVLVWLLEVVVVGVVLDVVVVVPVLEPVPVPVPLPD
jgi:hypothetical protein